MAELFDILTVAKDSRADILNIPEDPARTEVGSLDFVGIDGAEYEICMSINATFADTNDSMIIEYSLNGLPFRHFEKEPKDTDDITPFYYAFPYTHTTGNITLVTQVSKTTGGANLDVLFADTWIKRIG